MPRTASLPIFHRRRGGRTLQDQIYRCIRQSILDGLVGADRRLPSTRALAADLGVSRTTVLLALEQLRAEGYVVARRGSGMFIAPDAASAACRAIPLPAATPGNLRSHVRSFRGAVPPCRACGRQTAGLRRSVACAFRLGTPALDLFPQRLWSQTHARMPSCAEAVASRLLATRGFASAARGHRRAGAVARYALRRRSDPGGHGCATRPRPDRAHAARSRRRSVDGRSGLHGCARRPGCRRAPAVLSDAGRCRRT